MLSYGNHHGVEQFVENQEAFYNELLAPMAQKR